VNCVAIPRRRRRRRRRRRLRRRCPRQPSLPKADSRIDRRDCERPRTILCQCEKKAHIKFYLPFVVVVVVVDVIALSKKMCVIHSLSLSLSQAKLS